MVQSPWGTRPPVLPGFVVPAPLPCRLAGSAGFVPQQRGGPLGSARHDPALCTLGTRPPVFPGFVVPAPPPLVEGRGHRIVDGPDHQRNTACYLGKIGKVCRFVHILPSAASCGERATFRRKPRRKDLLTRNFWLPPPHVRSPPWRAPHARVPAFRAWLN
jgi:hypothetical protein